MSGNGNLSFSGTIIGLPSGQRTISITYALTSAIDDALPITLNTGDNVITVPAGANGVVIAPPSGNTVALTVGTLGIHPTFGMIYFIAATQVSFIINAAGPLGAPVQLTYF